MKNRLDTFEEFAERVRAFHGFAAPGVMIGRSMVALAYRHLPQEGLLDALCETSKCLPDAIQLLTPCTAGNGWLTVVNTGRYALTLYDKSTGEGVRVSIDAARLEAWPEINDWFFKRKPKKEQDYPLLMAQIKEAGGGICGVETVKVADRFLKGKHRSAVALCPGCREAYPVSDGEQCLACRGELLFV